MAGLAVAAIILAAVGYGSYFVPAKKYEVHDGVVYQWFFCSGIMVGALSLAVLRNDWWADSMAGSAFYVAPEGLLSGLAWQFSNLLATKSVRYFGLGNYYTWHELTNLGGTFVVGVIGPSLGIPAKAPQYVDRAALGFVLVFLGMIPIAFMREEDSNSTEASAEWDDCAAGASCTPSARTVTPPAASDAPSTPSQAGRGPGSLAALRFPTSAEENGAAANCTLGDMTASSRAGARQAAAQAMLPSRKRQEPALVSAHAGSADGQPSSHLRGGAVASGGTYAQRNAMTWDGTAQNLSWLRQMSQRKQAAGPQFGASGGIAMLSASDVAEESNQVVESKPRDWLKGWVLALFTGTVLSLEFEPMLQWKQRMNRAGITVSGVDFVFSLCVGIYLFSTLLLITAGALRRIRGQAMQKSVLRPPLLAGFMWTWACCGQLYAAVVLPYAVAYCLGVGGGLSVSLLWGVFWFGEATSRHNRLCVALSFVGVIAGTVLLAIAA